MKPLLLLTAEQTTAIAPFVRPGIVLLAKITREQFDGTNGSTSGALAIEVGSVPESSLPALREAIRKASEPPSAKKAKRGSATATTCDERT